MAVDQQLRTSHAELRAEVEQFYARQMRALDTGAADEWATTFTRDGVFSHQASEEPVRGRDAIAAGARAAAQRLADAGEQRRHLLSMLDIDPRPDGTLLVRSYAQIVGTRRNTEPRLHLMCVCDDVLVREGGTLLTRERRVTRDDITPGGTA